MFNSKFALNLFFYVTLLFYFHFAILFPFYFQFGIHGNVKFIMLCFIGVVKNVILLKFLYAVRQSWALHINQIRFNLFDIYGRWKFIGLY